MGLEQKLSLRLSQRLVMTPTLQQAIKLLQMTRLELQDVVNQELVSNPVLEEQDPENPGTPTTIPAPPRRGSGSSPSRRGRGPGAPTTVPEEADGAPEPAAAGATEAPAPEPVVEARRPRPCRTRSATSISRRTSATTWTRPRRRPG